MVLLSHHTETINVMKKTGSTWTSVNVCEEHNALLPDEPSWHYSASGEA